MKNFLKFLLVGLLCLAPTLGSDATQRVAGLVSPQSINVDLAFVQVGDVGNLSIMGAPNGATFRLLNNPGGHFGIVGTEIIADDATPAGKYSLTVEATGDGFVPVKKTFVLNFSGHFPPPPPGVFSVGVDIVGAQNPFPSFPTTASINYFSTKKIKHFRFAIGWSQVNNDPQYNSTNHLVGIQTVAFGPLDTTSTVYGGTSYVANMNRVISDAMNAGGQVLIDIHMFGNAPGGGIVGSATCPYSCFADLWGKIADYYVHVRPDLLPGIYGFDLMNEWPFIDSAIAFNGNQAAITAARTNGYTGPLYIEGVNFSSAWNWVSGQTQSFNNSNLYQLVDPLNNLLSSAHMYPDPDDSGSINPQSFAYSVAITVPGSAPSGLNVNPTIGVTRTDREWQPWTVQHSLRPHIGEFGTSNDNPWVGGAFDYPDWNIITRNLLTYLQANNIEINLWASNNGGAGYGPNGYAYSLDPFNSNLSGALDFTAAGVQEPVWTVIDDFTGYTGPQPTAYALFAPGLSTPNPYISVGTPSSPFTLYYGGRISSPVTITPHATLADGTSAGGTFAPATITLAAGDNAVATFTYTASQAATIKVSTTNNRGWADPPVIGVSSVSDPYRGVVSSANMTNEYGMYNRYTPYIGPAIRLQRASDNQQMDWFFTIPDANGNLGFDRQAIQDWAGSQNGIRIITWYDQSGKSNHINFGTGGNYPALNLKNAAGYPEVTVTSAGFGEFTTPISCSVQFSSLSRMSQAAGSTMGPYRMDWFVGPIVWIANGFTLLDPFNQGNNATVTLNTVNGTYHNYAVTWVNSVTNGFIAYKDAASQSTATLSITATPPTCNGLRAFGNQTSIEFGFFKNPQGSQQWRGVMTSMELLDGLSLTSGQVSAINTYDANYYSTPLPDALSAVPPTVVGAGARTVIVSKTSKPFSGITISDSNSGSPVDDLTLTLTGSSAGTLTGTGLSGTGPYTIAADTPANVTTLLQGLTFTPSGTVGQSTTIAIHVNSSAGTNTTNASTVITIQAVAPAETAFAAPAGTFTPTNMSGPNIIAAQGGYPDTVGFNHIYPTNDEIDYWAGTGSGSMRLHFLQVRLQPVTYGPLDPPKPRVDNDNYSYGPPAVGGPYANGTQVNLAEIKRVLDRARSHNMYVQLCIHQNTLVDTQNGVNRVIGNDAEATNIGVDIWQRIATVFKNYDNAIFEPFNEPVASSAAANFTFQVAIANAIAAITTTQWVYLQTNFFSGGNTYVSRGEPASWNSWVPPAGLKWALVLHQYLNAANDGFTADVVLGKGASALSAATTSMRAAGIKAVLTETGWSPSDAIVSPGTGVPSVEGNAILNFAKTNSDVFVGWNYWLGGSDIFEGDWGQPYPGSRSVFSAVPKGLRTGGTIIDAPQVSVMQSNFLFLLKRDVDPSSNDNSPMWLEKAA